MRNLGWRWLVVPAALASFVAVAIVPSARWADVTERRLAELDTSLAQLQTDLHQTTLAPAQKEELTQLQHSLEVEKKLLLERRELLKRLEDQGLLMYVSPPPTGRVASLWPNKALHARRERRRWAPRK